MASPQFTMPRDMSKYSSLEAELLQAVHGAGLPEPESEYRFDTGCCGHPKRRHRYSDCEDCAEVWMDDRSTGAVNGTPLSVGIRMKYYGAHSSHDYRAARRWRFDFAWPAFSIAIECEGATWSGGRHTRGSGFAKDAEKYNAAALDGWVVLRFTKDQIESGEAIETIQRALGVSVETA